MTTWGGAATALAAGALTVLLHREPASLGPSSACPGLAEALSTAGAALAPRAALGEWIAVLAAISLATAVALTIAAARVRGVGAGPATAAGMTFGLLAMFSRRFVPPDAIAAAAAAASFLLLAGVKRSHPPSGRPVLVALALTAMAVPGIGLALGLTALGVALVTQRGRGAAVFVRAAAYTAVPVALAWAVGRTLPALPTFAAAGASSACVAPAAMIHLSRVWPLVSGTFTGAGPYAVALAALGAFSSGSTAARIERWPVYALAILPVLVVGASTVDSSRAAIPLALGFWLLAAVGLQQLVLACRRGVGGRIAAILLVVLLPGFRVARPPDAVVLEQAPAGESTLSVDAFRRVLGMLPARSVLVQEDALTDILLRATWRTRQRSGKWLELADRNSATLPDVAKDGRVTVIAFPSAQVALRDQGFQLSTFGTSGASGLAEVTPGAACAPVGRTWQDETGASATGEIAIVAADANARGPLVLYASSTEATPAASDRLARRDRARLFVGRLRPAR